MRGWGERYCNNVNYVKNNAIFKPPSMRACSSTPPKQNQEFVKEHNRTPLIMVSEQKVKKESFNSPANTDRNARPGGVSSNSRSDQSASSCYIPHFVAVGNRLK